jgi:two-component system response regulator PilR (NtrC family)
MAQSILIAEDEAVLRGALAELLTQEGYEVLQAGNGKEAYDLLLARGVDLILSDVRMPEMDGMQLLDHVQRVAPQTPFLVLTAYGTVETAVAALRAGAADYLLKPVQFDEVLVRVRRALEHHELLRCQTVMVEQAAAASTFHNLVGQSPGMVKLFDMVRKLSTVQSTVLLVGESGTGKELFARAIHYNGSRRTKPFVAVNCGAIPDSLIESELFGHRRGSFTGATRDKVGYFEAAHGGTLFLDEISTLPITVQSSLLRVLEERAVVPVGETRPRPVDARIIAASNKDVDKMVREGAFREDLLYRLNVVTLTLPPLRQRKEDLPPLAQHFLDKYTKQMNRQVQGLSNAAMRAMLSYSWPGNIREFEHAIERAVIFAEGRLIELDDLPFAAGPAAADTGEDLKEALRIFERQHILMCLRRHQWDKAAAATHLGIGVSSLYRKLDELQIPKTEPTAADAAAPAPSSTAT